MARSKLVNADFIEIFHPIGSMGPQELTIHVGKYTVRPMQGDPMGYSLWSQKMCVPKLGSLMVCFCGISWLNIKSSTSFRHPCCLSRSGGVVFLVLSCVCGIIQNEYNSQCRRGQIVLALHYQPLLSRHDSVTWTVRSNEFSPSRKQHTVVGRNG